MGRTYKKIMEHDAQQTMGQHIEHHIQKIINVHGHAGIWAALGYKAGLYAREELRPEWLKDMDANISLPYKTPYSCFLDGIQAGSSCTVGKCNLRYTNNKGKDDSTITAKFENKRSGAGLVLRINQALLDEIKKKEKNGLCCHEHEIENTKWILEKSYEELFDMRHER